MFVPASPQSLCTYLANYLFCCCIRNHQDIFHMKKKKICKIVRKSEIFEFKIFPRKFHFGAVKGRFGLAASLWYYFLSRCTLLYQTTDKKF